MENDFLIEARQNIELAELFIREKELSKAINPRQDIKVAEKLLGRALLNLQLCRLTHKTKK